MTTGVREDVPEQEYHADTERLSVSGAKLLLPPSCPALYRWTMDNGQPHKAAFDIGHAAHKLVLGVGAPLRVIEFDDWRTKAAKDAKAAAYEAGEIPLKATDHAAVTAMADAVRAHPLAAALFRPGTGKPEASLYWDDPATGVPWRGRLDWLPDSKPNGRMVIPDLKTSVSADPMTFAKSAATYGYPMQAAGYSDAAQILGLADDVAFVFVVVAKDPPHLVSVVELDPDAVRIGREMNAKASRTFKRCTETGNWFGYSPGVEMVSLPIWWQREHGEGLVV